MRKNNKQRLGIIGTVGVPAKYGGFETLIHQIVPRINNSLDITVYCSGKAYSSTERKSHWNKAKLHYIPLKANGIQSVLYDLWSILHAIITQDILLILGVSGCLFLPVIKLFSKKKIIVNIDGLEWKREKWNKFAKKFLLLSEQMACMYADEIVTDNQILKEYVKIRYELDGNLIEYGADHVKKESIRKSHLHQYDFLGTDYAFKVARIEPENNIHLILEAFSELLYYPLVIVGNWNNSFYGKKLREKYGSCPNIHLLDSIYESSELNLLRSNAKIYIHGHSAGGTNPSLVEAMYLGLPVISFDVIYNRVTTNNQGLFFCDKEGLKAQINQLSNRTLSIVSKSLKEFADRKYTWSTISQKYTTLIEGNNGQEWKEILPATSKRKNIRVPQKVRA